MRVLLQLLGAAAAVAVAGVGAAVLAKKMGKKCPIQVTVDLAEDAETDKETADKTTAAYEARRPPHRRRTAKSRNRPRTYNHPRGASGNRCAPFLVSSCAKRREMPLETGQKAGTLLLYNATVVKYNRRRTDDR